MKRHLVKHGKYCVKVTLIKEKKNKYLQKLLVIAYRKKRAQMESLVIYRKNNLKKQNNISIEEILSLCFRDSGLLENTFFLTGWVQSSDIISYVSLRIKSITWSFQRETNPV